MNMKNCPECGTILQANAYSCSCGWGRRPVYGQGVGNPITEEQKAAREAAMALYEARFTAECRTWLDNRGITHPKMTREERNQAMKEYRDMLKRHMRVSESHPRAWAHVLKTRYLDGEVLLPIQVQLASEAMCETWKNGECSP
jgi:hypothetical protein